MEDNKTYMQEYYSNNKQKIAEKNKRIDICPNCNRKIQHTYINRHKKLDICKNASNLQKNKTMKIYDEISKLKEQLNNITSMLDD